MGRLRHQSQGGGKLGTKAGIDLKDSARQAKPLNAPTQLIGLDQGTLAAKGVNQGLDGSLAQSVVGTEHHFRSWMGCPKGHSKTVGHSRRARMGKPPTVLAKGCIQNPPHGMHVVTPMRIGFGQCHSPQRPQHHDAVGNTLSVGQFRPRHSGSRP